MEHLRYQVAQRQSLHADGDQAARDYAQNLIEELNAEEVVRLAPTMAYLLLIVVVGIPGNGIVLYLYRTSYTVSSSKWFIFFLALLDIVLCLVIIPAEVATLCYQYTFTNAFLCKFTTFMNLWGLLALGFTLVVVSVDRYRKVCRPLGSQMDFRKARISSVVAVLLGFVIALPIFSVYGIYEFQFSTGLLNVTASECSFRKTAEESGFAFYYVLFGMAMFTGALATICILYILIGKDIKQHIHRENIKRNVSLSASMAKRHQVVSVVSNKTELKSVRFHELELPKRGVRFNTQQETSSAEDNSNASASPIDDETCDFELPNKKLQPKKMEKTKSRRMRQAKARKATFSMFLISIAFVLSYLPFLCLLLVSSVQPQLTENLSDGGRAAYKFFLRSFFFNCAVNPFIYGVADSRFRDGCRSVVYDLYDRLVARLACREPR